MARKQQVEQLAECRRRREEEEQRQRVMVITEFDAGDPEATLLGPQDLHPLDDHDLNPAWEDDDPRAQAWLRVTALRFRLNEAMAERIFGADVFSSNNADLA